MPGRRLATLAIAACACASGCAGAQTYPAGPIRMIVPFPAGGGVDDMARILGQQLATSLGKAIVIDNRAGGEPGADHAAGAAAIVDDDRLAQRMRQPVGDDARHRVDAAAGRERHDQRDRTGGIALRAGAERRQQKRDGARRAPSHDVPGRHRLTRP